MSNIRFSVSEADCQALITILLEVAISTVESDPAKSKQAEYFYKRFQLALGNYRARKLISDLKSGM